MSEHQRLVDAVSNSGYYNYWKRLLTSLNLTTSNSFWNNARINVSQERNVMIFRTGTIYTQKNGPSLRQSHEFILFVLSSARQPNPYAFGQTSGCQNASIQDRVTERHNIASRLFIKTLSKGDFGGNIIFTLWEVLEVKHECSTKSGLAGTCSQQD